MATFADHWPRGRRLPIYTLRIPGVRLYIVNATSLIPPIQRQVRNISFVPVMLRMYPTLMNLSPATNQMISKDALEDTGALFGTPHLFHPSLNPGPQLDILNRKSVQIVASSLSKFAAEGASTVLLSDWVSRQVLAATTESVYGPQNPFRDPAVVAIRALVVDSHGPNIPHMLINKARKYEAGVIPLLYGVLPNLTARPYVQAREARGLSEGPLERRENA